MIKRINIQKSGFKIRNPKSGVCLIFVVCCLFVAVLYSCSAPKEKIYRKNMILMDTLITINVVSGSESSAGAAMDKAFAEVANLDRLLNFFSDKSEVSAINRNAGILPVSVSPETLDVIEKSLQISEKTGGAFDATIGPVITLWDFPSKPDKPPADSLIKEKLRLVNYKWVTVDKEKSTVYLKEKGMLLDLGGIAKGYAADKAVEELKKQGIKSGLVSVAGEIKSFGLKPDKSIWVIGIKSPRQKDKEDEIFATMELKDMSISTSGDYERYFIYNGKRYHHIIDPKTGYPADGCQSVSIIAKDAVNTDSLATAVFVLGIEKGMQTLKTFGFESVIVDKDGKMHITSGLKDKIEFKRNN